VLSTISSTVPAFPVGVASIGSESEINGFGVSATALTFVSLEEDGSVVTSSSAESAIHFFCHRAATFLPDMAMILPLQIPHQWLGFLHWWQSLVTLHFSYSEAGTPFKASSLLWRTRFGSSYFLNLAVSENRIFLCPLS
jgi:hypothetical protein